MRNLSIVSALFIFIFSPNLLAHRGSTDEHNYLSDPARIDEALEHLELEDPAQDKNLCEKVFNCLEDKQKGLRDFVENMAIVTKYMSDLLEDQDLRRDQVKLRELLNECRNLTTEESVKQLVAKIENTHWIHGSEDCNVNTDPEIQVEKMGLGLSIMRQNKCLTSEAPFLYILESEDKVMLIDTGDIREGTELYEQVKKIAGDREIVVTHTHAHGDHVQGDKLFKDKENCTLHKASATNHAELYNIDDWPNGIGEFDMGDRKLKIIPVPGHEGSSIAIYDPKSKMMMTGDIMYPGRLYISNYPEFLSSLDRLKKFSEENEVAGYLGGHVEMSREPGEDIGFGSYAPNERSLVLKNSDLDELYEAAYKNSKDRDRVTLDQFIIYP
jgi:hydroxyacylglutathione hydrolase